MVISMLCISLWVCLSDMCYGEVRWRGKTSLTLLIARVVISIVSVTQQWPPFSLLAPGIEGDCEDVILS